MITLDDKQILDEIETVINKFMTDFYRVDEDPNATRMPTASAFFMGQVAGILMKRGK